MLTVVAVLKAKEGKEKELEEALKKVVPLVTQEEGTLAYVLHRARKDPRRFFFYEKYKDKEALTTHGSSSYLKELFGTIGPLLEGSPSVETYEEIASIPAKG
ncbi:MAG: antibiotic biosynthesis monooxygenase [Deltaproteobacteria bacterium HGW-Deltaproteobacteria-21]|jgi:quinol monooxygenase YgiN|nr:MAG: antibiotic biosynthesis monooxygenase [Deltaproteobacteria bacterium HGW-Deltaproteobacteria-21]RJR35910.1 MAG: antibiotic biosynthesis monooxygenase [Desulfobacteraceae bacterium]